MSNRTKFKLYAVGMSAAIALIGVSLTVAWMRYPDSVWGNAALTAFLSLWVGWNVVRLAGSLWEVVHSCYDDNEDGSLVNLDGAEIHIADGGKPLLLLRIGDEVDCYKRGTWTRAWHAIDGDDLYVQRHLGDLIEAYEAGS